MSNPQLTITKREEGKNPRQIRSNGFIPVSIYGKNYDAKSAQVNAHEFELAYRNNKDGAWELNFDKEKLNAKIKELQIDYSTSKYLNIEFAVEQ